MRVAVGGGSVFRDAASDGCSLPSALLFHLLVLRDQEAGRGGGLY